METILRKQMWVLELIVLGATAVLAAHATGHVVDAALLRLSVSDEAFAGSTPTVVPVPAPDRRDEAIVDAADEVIWRRNIFCSSCARPSEGRGGDDAPPETSLPLRLLAIMYAPPPSDPRLSVAVIKDQRGAAGAYMVGASVDTAVVDAIDELRVLLRLPDGRRQALTLFDREPPRREGPAAASRAPDPLVAELDAGIKKTGENRYGVRRATIEALLGKMDKEMDGLPPQARLEPDVREGKAIGFRLRDVKADGVFAKIGLRDGDLISSVNGLATNGPDNALAIYTSLRSVGHLSVALERAGRRITTEYDIE